MKNPLLNTYYNWQLLESIEDQIENQTEDDIVPINPIDKEIIDISLPGKPSLLFKGYVSTFNELLAGRTYKEFKKDNTKNMKNGGWYIPSFLTFKRIINNNFFLILNSYDKHKKDFVLKNFFQRAVNEIECASIGTATKDDIQEYGKSILVRLEKNENIGFYTKPTIFSTFVHPNTKQLFPLLKAVKE